MQTMKERTVLIHVIFLKDNFSQSFLHPIRLMVMNRLLLLLAVTAFQLSHTYLLVVRSAESLDQIIRTIVKSGEVSKVEKNHNYHSTPRIGSSN